jgi:hypothetical protein
MITHNQCQPTLQQTPYVNKALDQMVDVIARVDDAALNERPHGPTTNSVAALVTHSVQVAEFWLGHVGLGRPTGRGAEERASEFSATATRDELLAMVAAARVQVAADLEALGAGGGQPSELRAFVPGGDDASLVLHVLEELYQHLGHMDLTADALTVGR